MNRVVRVGYERGRHLLCLAGPELKTISADAESLEEADFLLDELAVENTSTIHSADPV